MAQPYVTGPVSVYVGVTIGGVTTTPVFLCHGEKGPSIQIRPSFSPVFADISGQRVPLDYLYDGEEAIVTVDSTRFNESVYFNIANRASPGLGSRGTDFPGDIGTLMGHEGKAFPLWLLFPYAGKPAFSAAVGPNSGGPMPGGYHFFRAFLEGPDGLDGLGTTNRRTRFSFHCIRVLDPTYNGADGSGSLALYDHDMSAIQTGIN